MKLNKEQCCSNYYPLWFLINGLQNISVSVIFTYSEKFGKPFNQEYHRKLSNVIIIEDLPHFIQHVL